MPEPTTAEKFLEHYEKYQSAKSKKNECAKAVASSFALIGMTQQEGLESYQELYENSRPT